jgi:pyruvate formate lyase activating enzyme
MKIFGIQKLTLVDYPGKTAATIFLSGCDFRCPFCHNSALIEESSKSLVDAKEAIEFLKSRQKLLDGVCISGGEPLIQEGLEDFVAEIKSLDYCVKLDTNGQGTVALKRLVQRGLLDFVAMDIKGSLQNYSKAVGIENFDTSQVEESADFLLSGTIPYELRTTVVRELHETQDFHLIGQRFKGAKKYVLQSFKDSEAVLKKGLGAYSKNEMKEFCEILSRHGISAILRLE